MDQPRAMTASERGVEREKSERETERTRESDREMSTKVPEISNHPLRLARFWTNDLVEMSVGRMSWCKAILD